LPKLKKKLKVPFIEPHKEKEGEYQDWYLSQ